LQQTEDFCFDANLLIFIWNDKERSVRVFVGEKSTDFAEYVTATVELEQTETGALSGALQGGSSYE
jgi:hypothetical protein